MHTLSQIAGVAALAAALTACSPDPDRALAKQIMDDATLATVDSMGRAILSQGLNAGSGYSQVWARDMNTFVETALDTVPPQDIRGAILMFFALQQPNGEMVDGYVLKEDFTWHDPVGYYSDAAPRHVGFKKRKTHFSEHVLRIGFGKTRLTAHRLHDFGKALAK